LAQFVERFICGAPLGLRDVAIHLVDADEVHGYLARLVFSASMRVNMRRYGFNFGCASVSGWVGGSLTTNKASTE
jgi:hypothetical protein